MRSGDENDEFWKIALDDRRARKDFNDDDVEDNNNDDDSISEDDEKIKSNHDYNNNNYDKYAITDDSNSCMQQYNTIGKKYKLYVLNNPSVFSENIPIEINLHSLPQTDGAWSSVGSDVWYGSALLSTILLSTTGSSNTVSSHIQEHLQYVFSTTSSSTTTTTTTTTTTIAALELGSGAVGLSGFALICMLAMKKKCSQQSNKHIQVVDDYHHQYHRHQIFLSDNDPDVIKNLKRNIQSNLNNLSIIYADIEFPSVHITNLDWNNGLDDWNNKPNSVTTSSNILPSTQQQQHQRPTIHLAIGSELVYTNDTAMACITIVQSLLEQSSLEPLLIVIVQITDREGYRNTFIPTIQQMCTNKENTYTIVLEEKLNCPQLHSAASKLVPTGGTLNHLFDYSVCYIWNYKPKTLSNHQQTIIAT